LLKIFGLGLRGEKPVPPKEAVDPVCVTGPLRPINAEWGGEIGPWICWLVGSSFGSDEVEASGTKEVDDEVGGLRRYD
jgi:hypothetical protein